MKQLRLTDITKTFRTTRRTVAALDAISFTVQPGEFFVLLGPSGCGKSTLLNVIAGLEVPDSGTITLDMDNLYNSENRIVRSPRERNVAMVFQNYALYPHMTVAENIAFPLKTRRTEKQEITRRVTTGAEMLQIAHLLATKPAELSGGQRQRVAIARALVREPDLFLLDEPLSNLDAQFRTSMRNSIKVLQRRTGITTLYVTHDQIEAMTLGDRIAVLRHGKVEQIGTPRELYTYPANPFVASFIGSPPMNLLPARITIDSTQAYLHLDNLVFECPLETIHPRSVPGEYRGYLGIRPEHIRFSDAGNPHAIAVTVSGYEYLGRETVVYATCTTGSLTFLAGSSPLPVDSTHHVTFPTEMIRAFIEMDDTLPHRILPAG